MIKITDEEKDIVINRWGWSKELLDTWPKWEDFDRQLLKLMVINFIFNHPILIVQKASKILKLRKQKKELFKWFDDYFSKECKGA